MDLYGGGEGAPSIVFLHQCKEEFHCNVTLGQTFWEAITNATFYDRTCKYPLLRLALTLANETTDRKQDGIAKLITKSHIGSVTGKIRPHKHAPLRIYSKMPRKSLSR